MLIDRSFGAEIVQVVLLTFDPSHGGFTGFVSYSGSILDSPDYVLFRLVTGIYEAVSGISIGLGLGAAIAKLLLDKFLYSKPLNT